MSCVLALYGLTSVKIPKKYSEAEGQTIAMIKRKSTNVQTMIYNTRLTNTNPVTANQVMVATVKQSK